MIRYYGTTSLSHRNRRKENQDVCGYLFSEGSLPGSESRAAAFFVADGVSGAHGDTAAESIRSGYRTILARLLDDCISCQETYGKDISSEHIDCEDPAVMAFQHRILDYMRDAIQAFDAQVRGSWHPGTCCATISLAVLVNRYIFTANLGDSPIFLVELDEDDQPITLKEMYECQNAAGTLSEDEALTSPDRNLLCGNVLGDDPSRDDIFVAVADYAALDEKTDSVLLLLGSDGALSVFPKKTLLHLIARCSGNPDAVNHELFEAVTQHESATDNYTLLGQLFKMD